MALPQVAYANAEPLRSLPSIPLEPPPLPDSSEAEWAEQERERDEERLA